ncbi:MAG: hypothetical protein NT098_01395 [Candidatus Parcubacteria bacterium]|nr:hypothetical protein [Candidatus Parcubacteria bacterium]
MNKPIQKFHPENLNEDIIVEVTFTKEDGHSYKCAGILAKEKKESVLIGFTVLNDKVQDYLEIPNNDILEISLVKELS